MAATSTSNDLTLGLDTFGDVTNDEDGRPLMTNIELYGTRVAPLVRDMLA